LYKTAPRVLKQKLNKKSSAHFFCSILEAPSASMEGNFGCYNLKVNDFQENVAKERAIGKIV
jgi:hypothetical protein